MTRLDLEQRIADAEERQRVVAARQLLNRVRDGHWHSPRAIDRALRHTGDLPIRRAAQRQEAP